MSVQNRTPLARKSGSVRKTERMSAEDALKKVIEEHKKQMGEMIAVRVDNRTTIEVPASLSPEERQKRVESYMKNANLTK